MSKMTTKQRRRKLHRCGPGCFGDPNPAHSRKTKKAGRPRYPLCGGGCELSCKEAHAAWSRAQQQHERKVAKRIKNRAKRHGCPWARGK